MKIKYKFNWQQVISGLISGSVVILATYIFEDEIKWGIAIAIGIGVFINTGFYRENSTPIKD